MTATKRRLIGSWIVGLVAGTGVIAVTSGLFVRSYVPLQADPTRGVWTLPAGDVYRWRSEGYANTDIGPLGMPGKAFIEPAGGNQIRVALWGDSQAEGVCVADGEKLFAQAERSSAGRMQVFPFARSGEDVADWLTQMPAVEQDLDLDCHVILVVDLDDLLTAGQAPLPPPSESDVAAGNASIAAWLPAFVIQAARHLLREQDDVTPRSLRFAVGPRREDDDLTTTQGVAEPIDRRELWSGVMRSIRNTSTLPVLILYAPVSPQIVGGRVIVADDVPSSADYEWMKSAAEQQALGLINAREQLLESAKQGSWPHGFHNGYIGSGHLNKTGNAVVGSALVDHLLKRIDQVGDEQNREGN